jgi:hypothetical protein
MSDKTYIKGYAAGQEMCENQIKCMILDLISKDNDEDYRFGVTTAILDTIDQVLMNIEDEESDNINDDDNDDDVEDDEDIEDDEDEEDLEEEA